MRVIGKIVILSALSVCCLLASNLVRGQHENDQTIEDNSVNSIELPKIFDFEKYVKLYEKKYNGVLEWMDRARFFFARAYKVFIQRVRYLHRLSSKYFALNKRSDWTPAERKLTRNFKPDHEEEKKSTDADMMIEAVELKTIERKLSDIVGHKHERPEYELIAEQLEETGDQKRSIEQQDGELLSLDKLIRDPHEIVERRSNKFVYSIPSNNPDYQEPELMSEGVDGEQQISEVNRISVDEMEQIESKSSSDKGSLVDLMDYNWFGAGQPDSQTLHSGEMPQTSCNKMPIRSRDPADGVEPIVDLRNSGCLPPVKDQHSCGSCYIFASLTLYEYHHCLQTGKLVEFSEQYVIDCGKGNNMHGCRGGEQRLVGEYVNKFGLELSHYYPYESRDKVCPYDKVKEQHSMGHTRVSSDSYVAFLDTDWLSGETIESLLNTNGPLSIAVACDDDFEDYGGGVDTVKTIDNLDGVHAMVLIGHGRQDGRDYWLLRNSYGPDWGESGHYKLDRASHRNVILGANYVEVKFRPNLHFSAEKLREKIRKTKPMIEKFKSWLGKP